MYESVYNSRSAMNAEPEKVIVDIQFVVGNFKEYYIKELSVLKPQSHKLHVYIFKPKFEYSKLSTSAKKQNRFIFKHINGLQWNDGDIDYEKLPLILNSLKDEELIVRGFDKKRVLEKYLPGTMITDLTMTTNLASCKDPEILCRLHKNRLDCRCAVKTVIKINNYLNKI